MDKNARDQARQAVVAYNAHVAKVREDRTLSEHGRREAVRAAYESAAEYVNKIRAKDSEEREATRSSLSRRLFGLSFAATPAEVVAYRDAQDRVSKVTDARELGEIMQRAADSGDRQLLKAGAAHAFTRSRSATGGGHFNALLDEYALTNTNGRDLEEYREVLSSASATAEVVERMQTSPRKPPEVDDRRVLNEAKPRTFAGGKWVNDDGTAA